MDAVENEDQGNRVSLEAKGNRLEMDLETLLDDLARHVAEVSSLKAVVKEADSNVVAKVRCLKAKVATTRADLNRRVAVMRTLEAVLKRNDDRVVAICANAIRMMKNMRAVFISGPSALLAPAFN